MATLAPGQQAKTYALGKVARGGNTRGGYTNMQPFVSIGGVHYGYGRTDKTQGVLVDNLSIHDTLDEAPNTLQMTVRGFVPQTGQEIIITLGSKNSGTRYFAGLVLSTDEGYLVDNPQNIVYQVNGIDYSWQLTQHLVVYRYTNWTAAAIIRHMVASWGENFTTKAVAGDLDLITLDEITFTNTAVPDAITQVCERVGAYWYVDYFRDVHAFTQPETMYAPPVALTPTHRSLRDVKVNRDLSQIVTRALVEGGGTTAPTDIVPGETMIPVDTVAWYQSGGGRIVSGPQRMTYTGYVLPPGGGTSGALGSLVGPGVTPTSAPAASLQAAAGIEAGDHTWAYTWVTASGETKPSPLTAAVTMGPIAPPTTISVIQATDYPSRQIFDERNSGIDNGYTVEYCYVHVYGGSSTPIYTTPSPIVSIVAVANPWGNWYWSPDHPSPLAHILHGVQSPDPRSGGIYVFYRVNGGAWNWYNYNVPNYPGPGYPFDFLLYGSMTPRAIQNPPATNPQFGTAALTGIATGPTGVTARKVYRTTAGGTQLKLVATIADNTTTTYTDNKSDAALGANAPTADTSALTPTTTGSVVAGSTSLLLAGTGNFNPSGGWVVIGNGQQYVRYTGISGNSLTGIPASGPGSITATVSYGSTATAAPALVGIPALGAAYSILYPIKSGDDINLLVVIDDPTSQVNLANVIGGTGIKESYIQDRRISYTEAQARGRALLSSRSTVLITVSYSVRDPNTRSGRTIHVALPAPFNLTGDFKIQDVTIKNFWPVPGVGPTFTCTASSNFYSLADLLRVARNTVGA